MVRNDRDNRQPQQEGNKPSSTGKEIRFSTNSGVDAIIQRLRSNQLDKIMWNKIGAKYIRDGYHMLNKTDRDFPGIFFELYVNQVIDDTMQTSSHIADADEITTPHYNFRPTARGKGLEAYTSQRYQSGHEYDRLLIVTGSDGSKLLLAVEAKFHYPESKMDRARRKDSQHGGKTALQFLSSGSLREYVQPLEEYMQTYNAENPESPLTGYGSLLVTTEQVDRGVLAGTMHKIEYERMKGRVVGILPEFMHFPEKAQELGAGIRKMVENKKVQ